MARGFGATRGVASTDRLVTNVNPVAGNRTIFIVSKRNGGGGGGFGRYWDTVVSTVQDALFHDEASGRVFYQRTMGSVANWYITAPASGSWHTIGVSMNASSTSNDPVIYVNGSSVTVTENVAPTSAGGAGSNPYWIGNRPSDQARVWDGDHAEFAIWNSILTAGQHADLASGVSPTTIDSGNLILYVPLVSTLVATVGSDLTATGTAVTTHPSGFSSSGDLAAVRAAFYNMMRSA
jgi:hypothetical protein